MPCLTTLRKITFDSTVTAIFFSFLQELSYFFYLFLVKFSEES